MIWIAACSGPTAPIDAGFDAALDDAGSDDAGIDAATGPDTGIVSGGPCTAFADGIEAGRIENAELVELSGLAASRRNEGLLYAHNDAGNSAGVFLLDDHGGDVGIITVNGATNVDWEDIAVAPGPDGTSWVWVADTGDNEARTGSGTPRSEIVVYRFAEPAIDLGAAPVALSVDAEALRFTYPVDPHDCEAMAVDPLSGDVYLLTKEDTGASILYESAAPQDPTSTRALVEVTSVRLGLTSRVARVTAMDLSTGGRGLLVRTTGLVRLYVREPAEGWDTALARTPLYLPSMTEIQGEAIAWSADGRGYYTSSEGTFPPLHFFAALDPTCEPL